MSPASVVEHVVLFRIKDGADPAAVASWLEGLRSLAALEFTHALHCRYRTAADLAVYATHPAHLEVVRDFGAGICESLVAVDWVAELDTATEVGLRPSAAVRVTLARLREGAAAAERTEVAAALREAGASSRGVEQVTGGENFSPARADGFAVASLWAFPSSEELPMLEVEGSSGRRAWSPSISSSLPCPR
ncbi:unnamed protein product [Spirodela intermedia]|uniref:Stress-response A/B barrel domain-containing protein n=1 Tax=Spirodela intermedia TaxID=51605 RepID=A0A7I8J4H5_SPIIN|nr:unnamed protein product [Spirodela intermedia]CAA6664675.1 unnamed protein product [Spirodela intermedia]